MQLCKMTKEQIQKALNESKEVTVVSEDIDVKNRHFKIVGTEEWTTDGVNFGEVGNHGSWTTEEFVNILLETSTDCVDYHIYLN